MTMEKVWLSSYSDNVAEDINVDEYQSVYEIFHKSVEKNTTKPCFTNLGTTLNYNEIGLKVDQLAAYLQQVAGLQKGDRIAIMMTNILQNPIAIFAALKAGLIPILCIRNTNIIRAFCG